MKNEKVAQCTGHELQGRSDEGLSVKQTAEDSGQE
jgi:hypothetical protein